MSHSAISASTIEVMKQMAGDHLKSQALVQDEVCMGGLVMVLSNYDPSVVFTALETLLKLAEWPNLRSALKDFLGMKDQLDSLMLMASPAIQNLARRVYSLLYCGTSLMADTSSLDASCAALSQLSNVPRKDGTARRHRRNSFFMGPVAKAKTVVLQIRGLNDKDDMDVCRSGLLTVTGVISITFDMKKRRAILRAKHDLRPELLARAIARTMTMSAEQVVKNDGGVETFLAFGEMTTAGLPPALGSTEMPDYPSDVDIPVSGNQNVVRHGSAFSDGTWSFIGKLGSVISNSLYW